jgi:hypothetical protein
VANSASSQARKRARARAVQPGSPEPVELRAPVELVEATAPPVLVHPVVAEDGASLEAEHVALRMSAVGRVEAGELRVTQGAVGAARTETLTVEQGAVGAVLADRADISRGYARTIIARQVQIDRGAARVVIAADVNAQQTAVLFLVARRVAGDVRVLFDWRGALAFGAALGAVVAIAARLRRRTR